MNVYYAIGFYLVVGYINLFLAMNIISPYSARDTLSDIGLAYLPFIPLVYIDSLLAVIYSYFHIKWFIRDKNILANFYYMMGILMFLRLGAFSITLLPASLPDCVSRKAGENLRWMVWQFDQGCIDNMFSGHAVHITMIALNTMHFSENILERKFMEYIWIPYLLMIVASRLHYSVDVYIGTLLSIAVFYLGNRDLFTFVIL